MDLSFFLNSGNPFLSSDNPWTVTVVGKSSFATFRSHSDNLQSVIEMLQM